MRKKNLSVKVAALAMSGTLAMAPMTVRADEVTAANTPAAESAAASTAADTAIAGSSATVSGTTESGTGATAGTTTAPAPVTVEETPVDSSTTVPNNVNTVVSDDDKQGTDIGLQIRNRKLEAKISASDANENGEDPISGKNPSLNVIPDIANLKNKDVVMQEI